MQLTTERLSLRKFQPSDWHAVLDYMSDTAVTMYLPDGVLSEQEATEFVNSNLDENSEKFAVLLNNGNVLIGHMVFMPWYGENTFEIGWVFNPEYQNQGFATEAAYAILKYAFEELNVHRIISTCQPENVPSWRIMEKIGMRREAHFKKCMPANFKTGTGWWDEYFYAMLEEEWIPK